MHPVDQLALMVRYGALAARALVVRTGRLIYGPWARAMVARLGPPVRRFLWKVWARVKELGRQEAGMAGRQPEPGSPQKFFAIARAAGLSKAERTRLWEAVREAHPTATPEGLAFVADTPPAKTAPPRRLHQRLHQLLTFPANRRPFLTIFRSIPVRP